MKHRTNIADVLLILFWIAVIAAGWLWADPYNLMPLDPLGSFK